MAKKLSSHITALLDNKKQPRKNNFADFYSLVKEMMEHNSQPDVYQVVSECIHKHFSAVANGCRLTAAVSSSMVNLTSVQSMMDFHSTFFGDKLLHLAAAMAYAERRTVPNPAKPVLLNELCCRAFLQCFLSQEGAKQYIADLIVSFFTRMRNSYTEKLLSKAAYQLRYADRYQSYMAEWTSQQQSASLVINLVKILISLDRAKLSVFHSFVLLPLVKRSISYGRTLASEQLLKLQQQQPGKTMNDYLRWLTSYLQTDRYLLEKQFNFPAQSAEMMSAILCHIMGSLQMDAFIIGHPNSGFKALLANESFTELATMHSLLEELYKQTKQAALFDSVNQSIKQHFEDFQSVFYASHHLTTRNDQMAFVKDLIMLKHKWNRLYFKVFSTFSKEMKVVETFKKAWHHFMYNMLQHYEAVPLALAFCMHNLFLQGNNIVTDSFHQLGLQSALDQSSLKDKLGPLTENQSKRICVLLKMLSFLKHMKDVNNFYDYCKYYFCSRLLNPSAAAFSPAQELVYFEALVEKVKQIFVDNPSLTFGNNTAELQHKQFTQSLGDFDVIANSWRNSNSSQLKAKQIRICQLANWKLLPFDRCHLPQALEDDLKKVEESYQTKYKSRKLLLNTTLGRAIIEAKPNLGRQPVSLSVSLHQLAILEQFNAVAPSVPLAYEQLLKGGQFLVESSAKLALLSLVHGGLLKVSQAQSVCSSLKFEVDENFDTQKASGQNSPLDFASLEEVNYWTEEAGTVDLKTTDCMKALRIADADIVMASIVKSVEDVRGNYAFLFLNQLKNAKLSKSSSSAPVSTTADNQKSAKTVGDSVSDRLVKIEAAIARVIKRAGQQVSLQEIYSAAKTELFVTSRMPFPATDVLSKDEVCTWTLKLVEKNIVKRTKTGNFTFNLD